MPVEVEIKYIDFFISFLSVLQKLSRAGVTNRSNTCQ